MNSIVTQHALTLERRPGVPERTSSDQQPLWVLQCEARLHSQDPAAPSAPLGESKEESSSQPSVWTHTDVCGRLIVRFQHYKSADSHKADLAAALASTGDSWKWIDRQNAAASYPTDFALLEVADIDADRVKVSAWTAVSTWHLGPFVCTLCGRELV